MHRLSSLFQLILIAVVGHIALTGCRVTTSLYALSLHASPFQVGILIALFAVFPMIFAVPVGRLVDRIGIVRPMLWGGAVMGLGCALPSQFPGIGILYPAVAMIGAGFLALHVSSLHAVGAVSNAGNRAVHFSWLGTGYSVSSFSGPMLAGMLIDHTGGGSGHAVAYAVLAVFPLAAMALVGFGPLTRLILPTTPEAVRSGAFDLLREPAMRNIYLVGMLLGGAWDLYTFVVPIQGARMGFSASTIGMILGAFAVATFVVRLGMPWLAQRCSAWQIITAALCVAMLCYWMLPFVGTAGAMVAMSIVLGLALGSSQPNMLALLHLAAPEGRAGEAIGIRVTISNASQVVLPLAFGAAGATVGLFAVFWCMGAMIGSGVPVAWRQVRKIHVETIEAN